MTLKGFHDGIMKETMVRLPLVKRIVIYRGWTVKREGEQRWAVYEPGDDWPKDVVKGIDIDEAWLNAMRTLPDYYEDAWAILTLVDDLYDHIGNRIHYSLRADHIDIILMHLRTRNFEAIMKLWLEWKEASQ